MDWIWQRCFFLAEEVDPPLVKPPEMVLIVPRRGGSAGVMSVRADWGSWLAGWAGRLEGAYGQIEGVTGSRRVIISADEAAKVTSTDQFFYFILECFVVFCSVATVVVVAVIFGHISIRGSGCLAWWRNEVNLQGLIKEAGSGYSKGVYMVKWGWRGLRGRVSGWGDCGVGLAVVAA